MPVEAAREKNAPPNVVVIGSGLSAVGAIRALVKLGIKPTVLDWGDTLDTGRAELVKLMAGKAPSTWSSDERLALGRNVTLKNNSAIPKKLIFGSDYFYGKSRSDAPVKNTGNTPPFSYALGGLSVGWGAAVLPPQACDIQDWPISAEELHKYCERVLSELPYSSSDDGLSLNFPVLTESAAGLEPSGAEKQLIAALRKASILKKDTVLFGQARLLVNPSRDERENGCRYCGQCMSGCVYKSIYKASDEIHELHTAGKINYVSGCLVDSVTEVDNKVTVRYFDSNRTLLYKEFDRIFLAAGAVNSARIVLNSLKAFKEQVQLKTRGGYVMPVFSLRKLPVAWPNCNTQPGIFLEIKGKSLKHWVHVQISTENELLLQKLNIHANTKGILSRIKRFVASHLFLTFINFHSDHAGHYKLWLTRSEDGKASSCLHSIHAKSFPQIGVLLASGFNLLKTFVRIGCIPFFPFAKLNSGAYHVGATLPMKSVRTEKFDTDVLGRVSAWERIHVVDTSVFPSLPGTTIGLLAMANAYRIVDNIEWHPVPNPEFQNDPL